MSRHAPATHAFDFHPRLLGRRSSSAAREGPKTNRSEATVDAIERNTSQKQLKPSFYFFYSKSLRIEKNPRSKIQIVNSFQSFIRSCLAPRVPRSLFPLWWCFAWIISMVLMVRKIRNCFFLFAPNASTLSECVKQRQTQEELKSSKRIDGPNSSRLASTRLNAKAYRFSVK